MYKLSLYCKYDFFFVQCVNLISRTILFMQNTKKGCKHSNGHMGVIICIAFLFWLTLQLTLQVVVVVLLLLFLLFFVCVSRVKNSREKLRKVKKKANCGETQDQKFRGLIPTATH